MSVLGGKRTSREHANLLTSDANETHLCHLAIIFAVMHNASSPTTMW
jgi:hypothetical protein